MGGFDCCAMSGFVLVFLVLDGQFRREVGMMGVRCGAGLLLFCGWYVQYSESAVQGQSGRDAAVLMSLPCHPGSKDPKLAPGARKGGLDTTEPRGTGSGQDKPMWSCRLSRPTITIEY